MLRFLLNSVLLGVGLAMDAFSVTIADTIAQPCMRRREALRISGAFALFQFAMPLVGWFLVHNAARAFAFFQPLIPWIAFGLLAYIGGRMIIEALREGPQEAVACPVGGTRLATNVLLVQGVATSIDALSVGFAIAEYSAGAALAAALVIAAVTLGICLLGSVLGKKAGEKLAGRAQLLGGVILVGIGLEILLTHHL